MSIVEEFIKEVNDLEEILKAADNEATISWESERAFEHTVGEVMSAYSSILGAFIRVMNCWRALPRATQKVVIDELKKAEADNEAD